MKKSLQKRIIRVAKALEKLDSTQKKTASSPKDFLDAYIEAMLWSSTDLDSDEPLDKNYGPEDISSEAMNRIKKDCAAFLKQADDLIDGEYKQAGHDFWLTRNGHGAGFWDGDWEESVGKKLTELSHKFGELDPYAGDDGLIYF